MHGSRNSQCTVSLIFFTLNLSFMWRDTFEKYIKTLVLIQLWFSFHTNIQSNILSKALLRFDNNHSIYLVILYLRLH